MTASATKLPGTIANDASAGTIAWANLSNALVTDNQYATCTFTNGSGALSQYLEATAFGFAIPGDATIKGIVVTVERSRTVAGSTVVGDAGAFLVRQGVIADDGINKALGTTWATSDEVVTYGTPDDLWGGQWTPADINDSGFGFALYAVKLLTGTPDGRIDAITITVYFEPANQTTVVKLRDPEPPHGELATILATDVSYGLMLMKQQTASFRLSRADPNLVDYAHLFAPDGPPPMFTIERPDGRYPFVGFLKSYRAVTNAPDIEFTLADHAWRLANARTKRTGSINASSGQAIKDTMREMEARGEPPLYISIQDIGNGPGVQYEYRATSGLDFLTQMAQFTGWEWGFQYDIDRLGVKTRMEWRPARGLDRRHEAVLEEGKQIVAANWTVNYDAGIRAAVVIGAGATFATREAVSLSQSGRAADVDTQAIVAKGAGLGGARVLIDTQLSGREALAAAARRMHDSPDYVTRQIGITIQEPGTDMERLGVGDIISIRLTETVLGMPVELNARILGVAFDPESMVHRVELQEVA